MAKASSIILESHFFEGKVFVTTQFLTSYFNVETRTIANWNKKGLEFYKMRSLSKSNLYILQEVIEWREVNINNMQSMRTRKTPSGTSDEDLEGLDYEDMSTIQKKAHLRKLDKNKLDELNTAEQIIEREAKNKQHDNNWVRKEKPAQTIKALVRSFISLLRNMMISISSEGENKSQDDLYLLMDKYLFTEIGKFQKMLKDENAELDLHEIYQVIIDNYDEGVSLDDMVKKIQEMKI